MLDVVLQSTIDLESPGISRVQLLIALGLLAIFVAALAVLSYRSRTVDLSERKAAHVDALRGQLEAKTPRRHRMAIDADFDAHRDGLRSLWTGEHAPSDDEATVREAVVEIHDQILEQWRDAIGRVPWLSVRLVEEALVIFVLGALAVVSADRWEAWLSQETPRPEPGQVTATLYGVTMDVVDIGHMLLGLFPYGGFVFQLAWAYAFLFYQVLYNNWWVLSITLVVGAVLIAALDRRLGIDAPTVFDDRRSIGLRILAGVAMVWLAGVIPAGIGRVAGYGHLGGVAGFLAALILGLFLAVMGASAAWDRLRTAGRSGRGAGLPVPSDGAPTLIGWHTLVGTYLLVRRVWLGLALVGVTLIPIFLLVLLVDGQLIAILGALRAASPEVLLAIGLTAVAVLALVGRAAKDAWPELRTATRSALADQSVRLAVFGRGLPVSVVVAVYLLGMGFRLSLGLSLLLAVAAGILVRLGYFAFARLKYRTDQLESPDKEVGRILVEAWTLEDGDGEEHYLARVNGERLARSSIDAIVEEVLTQARSLRDDAAFTQTLGRHHAKNLLKYGYVNEDETETELLAEVRYTIETELEARNGRAPRAAIDGELEEFPAEIVDEKCRRLRIHGTDDWQLVQRQDYYMLSR